MSTVAELLARAKTLGVERLDAQALLAARLGVDRAWLIAHDDAAVAPPDARAFEDALHRRRDGVPVAYLVGHREFFGLRLEVDARVLDPRPDTETLVEQALALLRGPLAPRRTPRVLDLGTGSGAIALAIKHAAPAAAVHAIDHDPDTLALARDNSLRLQLAIELWCSDWWAAVPPDARFDLVLTNPPYLAADDPHLAALRHEPHQALVAGTSGLEAIEHIVTGAPGHMATGGWIAIEHGIAQALCVRKALAGAGFQAVSTHADLAGRDRCTVGQWQPE